MAKGSDRGTGGSGGKKKPAEKNAASAQVRRIAGKAGKAKSDHKRTSAYIPRQGGKKHR